MALSEVDKFLITAAKAGDTTKVEEALNAGADIHATDDYALRQAAENGHVKTVALLLDRGANIHAVNDEALVWAASKDNQEMSVLLLDRGADIHAQDNEALWRTTEDGHTGMTELLLDRGADIHALGDYPLHMAAGRGHRATAIMLLRHGADLNAIHGEDESAKLAEWMKELKSLVSTHFTSKKPSQKQCFFTDGKGILRLNDEVVDACVTRQFLTLIGAPLIISTDKADRKLFQDIWDALPPYWQDQNQDTYMQFAKEGGLNPVVGSHTTATQRDAGISDRLMRR